ncbi:MAG: hypothetical protein JWL76_1974 [Thermoleophilia bacterium]|nr:hypothetical protein [Thermoleophilia bacterium]
MDDNELRARPPSGIPAEEWKRWWKHFGEIPLRHLMLLYWDPIGVYGASEALDEYDRYVSHVGGMLMRGEAAAAISLYLCDAAIDLMGIAAPTSDDTARRAVEWFNDSASAFVGQSRVEQRLLYGEDDTGRSGDPFPSTNP